MGFRSGAGTRLRVRRVLCAVMAWGAMSAVPAAHAQQVATVSGLPWNFIFILTDDQRFDTLWAMPILQQRLLSSGVNFTNSFVSTPLCCPDRASTLSGGYLVQNTGVLANIPPNGGFESFPDADSMAVRLQAAGYRTGLIGKYMNGYDYRTVTYVPPGWDLFYAKDASRIEEYMLPPALDFIDQHQNSPFFLMLTPANPHPPATPAAQDKNLYSDYLYRDRGWGETDLTDKPAWVRTNQSDHGPDTPDAAAEDELHRNQLRSIQAVDRVIGQLMDKLEALGIADRTIVFFSSDNGYMWGEHGLYGKRHAYEESLRIPFVVRMPGAVSREETVPTASNLDVPATIFALAGLEPPGDGVSLAPLILDPATPWQDTYLIEHFGSNFPSQSNEVWAGFRVIARDGRNLKYIEYATGDKELYDLATDPYELASKHRDPAYADVMSGLAADLLPRKGLAVTSLDRKVSASNGKAMSKQFTAWGGDGNYTWRVVSGTLAPGLTFSGSGLLSGTPTVNGDYTLRIQVDDTRQARYAQRNQRMQHEVVVSVTGTPPPPPVADTDGDSVADTGDNCIARANASQTDSDGDGYGNRCDGDLNNDGKTDRTDFDILKPNIGKTYPAGDFDDDGKVNSADVWIFNNELFGKTPGPAAGK